MQGQAGGAPMWSVAISWLWRLWGFLGSSGQGQPSPVFYLGPPYLSHKHSNMAATCSELGDFQAKLIFYSRLVATHARPGAT